MYLVWILAIIQLLGYNFRILEMPVALVYAIIIFAGIGLLIALISMLNLGESLRFGLPQEKITLKNQGLYKYSRNPMYLGFYIMEISSMLLTLNPIIIVIGIYAISVHHLVTLSEERYLKKTFGKNYDLYCNKVRRYI